MIATDVKKPARGGSLLGGYMEMEISDVRQIWGITGDELSRSLEIASTLEVPPSEWKTIQLVSVEHLGDLLLETETQ